MVLLYLSPIVGFLFYRTTGSLKASFTCLLYLVGLTLLGIFPTLLTISLTAIMAYMTFEYMHTEIPEGVKEKWGARVLDTSLRTTGRFILTLHDLGVKGGCCRLTRKMVEIVLTTLITGSPFGKGEDPELKIYDADFDGVSVRVYDPIRISGTKRPVLVYYHGGGWSWLSVDVYDPATRELAKRVGMVVVSVNYRQSPENPHPIPFEDCLKATEYVLKNGAKLKVDPTRLAISGDSAGGHLTCAVSLRLKKKVKIQIPIYPCLQLFDLQTPSYIENKDYIPGMLCDVSMLSYWLNYSNISYDHMDLILKNQHTSPALKKSKYADYISPRWYMKEHIRTESLRNMDKPTNTGSEELSKIVEKTILDPYLAPLMADEEEFNDLPMTYVLTAGYDVLRDDGLIYYQRCKQAGVNVHLAHYPDGFHGMIFFFAGPMPFQVGVRAMDDLCNYLKDNL